MPRRSAAPTALRRRARWSACSGVFRHRRSTCGRPPTVQPRRRPSPRRPRWCLGEEIGRPSAPSRVETSGRPSIIASMILSRVPEPSNAGTIATCARPTQPRTSATRPLMGHERCVELGRQPGQQSIHRTWPHRRAGTAASSTRRPDPSCGLGARDGREFRRRVGRPP
jgi:hypothetical protein